MSGFLDGVTDWSRRLFDPRYHTGTGEQIHDEAWDPPDFGELGRRAFHPGYHTGTGEPMDDYYDRIGFEGDQNPYGNESGAVSDALEDSDRGTTQPGPVAGDQPGGHIAGDIDTTPTMPEPAPPPGAPELPSVDIGDPSAALDDAIAEISGSLDPARQQYEESMAAIEGQFEGERERLKEAFRLSETPEEQAQIEFMLEDLEDRRDAAQIATETEYDRAIMDMRSRADEMLRSAGAEGDEIQQRAQQQARAAAGAGEDVRAERSGGGLGVAAAAPGAAPEAAAEEMERRAIAEGDFAEAQGTIAASDVDWLGDTLAAEQPARMADLERDAAMQAAEMEMQHQQQVQDRIQQEHMMQQEALNQLAMQEIGAEQDMASQLANLEAQEAQMLADAQMQQGQMSADAQMQQAQLDADMAMREADMEMQQDQLAWEAEQEAAAREFEAELEQQGQTFPTDPDEQIQILVTMQAEGDMAGIQALANTGMLHPQVMDAFGVEPGVDPQDAMQDMGMAP